VLSYITTLIGLKTMKRKRIKTQRQLILEAIRRIIRKAKIQKMIKGIANENNRSKNK